MYSDDNDSTNSENANINVCDFVTDEVVSNDTGELNEKSNIGLVTVLYNLNI